MFDDPRWDDSRDRDERDRDSRDRCVDPRDVFMKDLDLHGGCEREIVHDTRGREYMLRGSETRTLSTVGAFRLWRAVRHRETETLTHYKIIDTATDSRGCRSHEAPAPLRATLRGHQGGPGPDP